MVYKFLKQGPADILDQIIHCWWSGACPVYCRMIKSSHEPTRYKMQPQNCGNQIWQKFTNVPDWDHHHPKNRFSSIARSCPNICEPMNRSTPGLPVHHQLPEFTETQVHRVSDTIQLSHPLSSPSPLAPNPSQHQSIFQWVNSWGGQSTRVSVSASFLSKKSQGWSPSEWTGWISLQSKGLSWVFSNTTVQKHQFFGAQLSSQSDSHIHTWPQEKP